MSRIAPLTGESHENATKEPASHGAAVSAVVPSVREIFDAYAPYLWRTLRHLGVPESDVEDVCQEVFVVVHRKIPSFERRSALKTWLYGICIRTASDYRRRAHVRRERAVSEPPGLHADATQFEELARRELRGVLAGVLEQLDADKRTVFVLYEIEELSMKEIAEIVGCPLQTAYSRLHAARKLLVDALKQAKAGR